MNRRWSALAAQAFGATVPAREAHPPLRRVSAAASGCSQRRAAVPRFGYARSIEIGKFAMNSANLVAGPIFRHEQRYLVSVMEIIAIQ